jgi:hypothetical protein
MFLTEIVLMSRNHAVQFDAIRIDQMQFQPIYWREA